MLASSRFRNYDEGSRAVDTTVTIDGQQVDLDGWIDFETHTGYAVATGSGFAPQLVRWNLGSVARRDAPAGVGEQPPLPMPAAGWQTRGIAPSESDLDAVLLVTANLGLDRPENPLLLEQGGALWLREATLATGN